VLTATDGLEGLKCALSDHPELILLDLVLPGLSGLDVLRQLHQQNCHIPTIVMTGYGSEQAILQAFRLGARDFLQKPFTATEVQSAIQSALAEERLQRQKEHLTQALAHANRRLQRQVYNRIALNDIAQAITSTLEEPEVFRRVMENVNRILQVEAGSLLLVDPETGELEFKVTLKGDAARFSSFRLKPGQGIAGWVAEHGKPLLVPDVRQEPRFYGEVDQGSGFHCHSILCVPLRVKGQVIGVLEVINKQGEPADAPFTHEDMELLMTLASWVAVAVENARLNRATQDLAAITTLRQAVTTLAHHVNNQLMALSLDLDRLEYELDPESPIDQERVRLVIATARRSIQEITAVVTALDHVEEIHTMPYVGTEEMIDIQKELEAQRRGVRRET
jgi:two-component system NtrC family sensor kinase